MRKTVLRRNNKIFLSAIDKCKNEEILTVCHKQQITLNQTVELLEKTINSFNPSSRETSTLRKVINGIIAYFKTGFFTIENTTSKISDQVEKIKQSAAGNPAGFFQVKGSDASSEALKNDKLDQNSDPHV